LAKSFQRRRPKVCRAQVAGEAHQGVPLALGDARILFFRRKKPHLAGFLQKSKLSKNTEINGQIVTLIS
jgi:hypothetical protein